jgi:hypothetical protein
MTLENTETVAITDPNFCLFDRERCVIEISNELPKQLMTELRLFLKTVFILHLSMIILLPLIEI